MRFQTGQKSWNLQESYPQMSGKCVYEALDKGLPEWAKKMLRHSISKEVYKGNASGPTKKAVVSVLTHVADEVSQRKPVVVRKERRVRTGIVMKQCRCVLCRTILEDEAKTAICLEQPH